MKKLLYVFCILIALVTFVACGGDGGDGGSGGDNREYTVTVIANGATVTSTNPVTVKQGESAVFDISIGDTYAFRSTSAGEYDSETGKLTVSNVTRDTRVNLVCEDMGCDTTATYRFHMKGTSKDACTQKNSTAVRYGTRITVTAGNEQRAFLGWSLVSSLDNGGDLLSTEKIYTFDLTEDHIFSNSCTIYANYADSNVYVYEANGGAVNPFSENISYNQHYTAKASSTSVEVTLSSDYFEIVGCASTFYDDGTFERPGYVLKEYNTRPDGSGTGYSLGSKFPLDEEGILYCIWAEDSKHSDFEYSDINIPLPEETNAAKAPHWVEDGIVITKYKGDDAEVVIPETIDGKTVTAIAAGAFTNKSMTSLVFNRRLLKVEDGAFVGCTSLQTIYYSDAIYHIGNGAFDTESFGKVKNFYVNATLAPRSTGDGPHAIKLTRFLTNADKKRIVVVAGSSSFQGLSAGYLEALLNGEYCVINFGTTRTTQIYMYLEALGQMANENDVFLYAPENSIYEMGETRLYWKTIRDMQGMYNLFRYIDISNYDNVLGAFAGLNRVDPSDPEANYAPRYAQNPLRYESIVDMVLGNTYNEYGEYDVPKRHGYCDEQNYKPVYELTFNHRFKSILEGSYSSANPAEEDWRTSEKWCSATESVYRTNMNRVISIARSSGAKVYFTFCPADALYVTEEAKTNAAAWFDDYEQFIKDAYLFDGVLGEVESYLYDHKYFYDNAFHPNDYGRTYRTYAMYCDLAELFGIGTVKGIYDVGTDYDGCLFEDDSDGTPLTKVDYLK